MIAWRLAVSSPQVAVLLSALVTQLVVLDHGVPDLSIVFMNRNARKPKKANHGARPCSHVARKAKKPRKGSKVRIKP